MKLRNQLQIILKIIADIDIVVINTYWVDSYTKTMYTNSLKTVLLIYQIL